MCDSFGGCSGPYATPFNTPGMGDVMPFGSGDRMDVVQGQKPKPKKSKPECSSGNQSALPQPPLVVYVK